MIMEFKEKILMMFEWIAIIIQSLIFLKSIYLENES